MADETFGDRLRSERRDRGLSIAAVAEALHVDPDRLRALERNDFERLPDHAAMMDCLHGYAECLDVDAELMIADYLREREGSLETPEAVTAEPVAEPAPVAAVRESGSRPRVSGVLLALAVVAAVALAAWGILSRGRSAPAPESSPATAPVESRVPSSTAQGEVIPTPVQPAGDQVTREAPAQPDAPAVSIPEEPAPTEAAAPPAPTISEFGLGTAVDELELVGRSDRFAIGIRVHFWTRVRGASAGDTIDHVWLEEGVERRRVSLTIGSANWRTYSVMRLPAGAAGDWAVEARDATGRVLARGEFVCVP